MVIVFTISLLYRFSCFTDTSGVEGLIRAGQTVRLLTNYMIVGVT